MANNNDPGQLGGLEVRVENGIAETFKFTTAMGGKVQYHKRSLLASTNTMRKRARARQNQTDETRIPIYTDIRDLGSHFSTTKRSRATTLKLRIEQALPFAKRIHHMKLTTKRKV